MVTCPIEYALKAELNALRARLEAAESLIKFECDWLVAAADIAELKWEGSAGHSESDEVCRRGKEAYARMKEARAEWEALSGLKKAPPERGKDDCYGS